MAPNDFQDVIIKKTGRYGKALNSVETNWDFLNLFRQNLTDGFKLLGYRDREVATYEWFLTMDEWNQLMRATHGNTGKGKDLICY